MTQFESKFAAFVIAHRALIVVACLACVAFMSLGTGRLYFDSSYRVFFSEKNPELLAFEAIENTYAKDDNVMVVLTPKTGTVFETENLAAIENITTSAWQIPYSNRVDSLANFQFTRAFSDDLIVTDLIKNANDLTVEEITTIKTEIIIRNCFSL